MKFNKDMLLLYAVTDRSHVGEQTLEEQVEDALRGGVTMVQLREKDLSDDELTAEAEKLCALCHRYGVPLIINDRADIALAVGADGVHVGIEDTPVSEIRRIAGSDFIIGATAKTPAQAKAAEDSGADYLGVGAVFPSPTKKNAIRITAEQLREICSCVSVPTVAIGGITQDNVKELAGGGMDGIAVVSALFSADDITRAAKELRAEIIRVMEL